MADMKKEKRKGVNQWQEVLNILLHNPNAILGFDCSGNSCSVDFSV